MENKQTEESATHVWPFNFLDTGVLVDPLEFDAGNPHHIVLFRAAIEFWSAGSPKLLEVMDDNDLSDCSSKIVLSGRISANQDKWDHWLRKGGWRLAVDYLDWSDQNNLVFERVSWFCDLLLDRYKTAQEKVLVSGRDGFVYLVREPKGYYKIGRSRNIKDRRRVFEVKLPYPVEFEHTIRCKDYYAAERELHTRYAAQRINGEWFKLTEQQVAEIKAIKEL